MNIFDILSKVREEIFDLKKNTDGTFAFMKDDPIISGLGYNPRYRKIMIYYTDATVEEVLSHLKQFECYSVLENNFILVNSFLLSIDKDKDLSKTFRFFF